MKLNQKKMAFVPSLSFPRTVLFGERGETVLQDLSSESTMLFISKHWAETNSDFSLFLSLFPKIFIHEGEPTKESLDAAITMISGFSCETILAVGGGSVIDLAKLVKKEHPVFLIAVPTTIGSGAEASQHALCTVGERKVSVSSPELIPDVVIMDPRHLFALSREQVIVQSFDVLAHGLESLVSRFSHPASDAFALEALEQVFGALGRISQGVNYKDELAFLQRAGFFAGIAQSSVGTGLAHACAHALGTLGNISHAQAIATVLYDCSALNVQHNVRWYDKLDRLTHCSSSNFLETLHLLYDTLPVPRVRLVSQIDIERTAEFVRKDVNMLTNPYMPSHEEICALLKKFI